MDVPPNKRMQLMKLRAAPVLRAGEMQAGALQGFRPC